MLVVCICVYRDLASSPYYSRSSTWLKTVPIGLCRLYCIDLVFCSRSISFLGKIFPYVTIKYWMSMKMVTVIWPVVLFLMAVIYFSSMANTTFWMSFRYTPLVSWKTHRFSSYWNFSSSWAWRVSSIGMLGFPGWT